MKVSIVSIARIVTAGLAASALFGCGGSGGGGTSSPNALTQGRAALNRVVTGGQPTNQQTLQSVLDLFLQAVQQNPNSGEAHFGLAICQAGLVSQQFDDFTGNVPPVPMPLMGAKSGAAAAHAVAPPNTLPDGEVPPSAPGEPTPQPIPPHRQLGLFWNLRAGLLNPDSLLHMLAPLNDLRAGFIPYFGYPQDDAARRQKMFDALNTVSDHLAKVEADPNFSVSFPAPDSKDQTVTVGLPEVYLFDAYVQSLRTELSLSLAYVRDPGTTWQPPVPPVVVGDGGGTGAAGGGSGVVGSGTVGSSTTGAGSGSPGVFWTPATLDKNKDGKLTPDEYLPPSPYLTLRDAKYLHTAQEAILAAVDRETKGIAGVLARPADGSGGFLVPNTPDVAAALVEVRDKALPLLKQAATGPFTLEYPRWPPMMYAAAARSPRITRKVFAQPTISQPVDGGGGGTGGMPWPKPTFEKLTVNLAAWFTNPPPDLKAFAPTLTLGEEGWPDPSKSVYPDPTFGGLFPDGIKDNLPF